jgi:hypothetical protein
MEKKDAGVASCGGIGDVCAIGEVWGAIPGEREG